MVFRNTAIVGSNLWPMTVPTMGYWLGLQSHEMLSYSTGFSSKYNVIAIDYFISGNIQYVRILIEFYYTLTKVL